MRVINTLQIGRAIAAVSVVMIHLSMMMGVPRYGGVPVLLEYTNKMDLGVDFFFVISGFIILYAHFSDIGNRLAIKKYFYRRFIRIFPIYWLYTFLLVAGFMVFGGVNIKIPNNVTDWLTTVTLIRFSEIIVPLGVAWTLFHEIEFYAVFSLFIINRNLGITALSIYACLSILFFNFPPKEPTAFQVYFSAYNLHFIFGMFAFWLYKRGGQGILEIVIGFFVFSASFIIYSETELLATRTFLALGMAFLLAGIAKLEIQKNIQYPALITFIGDASYSIYLTHANFLGTLLKVERHFDLRRFIGLKGAYFSILVLGIICGCIAYRLVEKPLLDLLRKRNFEFLKK